MENRIRELRKAAGLRQEDLARELGVTRQTINAIENNKYDPTLGLAMRLARLLKPLWRISSICRTDAKHPRRDAAGVFQDRSASPGRVRVRRRMAQSPPACSAGRDQGYRIILPGTPLWICARAASKSFMGKRPPIT